jgi:hypothetical protein
MSESTVFRREDLLGDFAPRIAEYPLRDGRTIWLRNLSAKEQGEHEYEQLDPKTLRPSKDGLVLSNARFIVRTAVDGPAGRRIFTPDDVPTIVEQGNALVAEIAALAEKHCGMSLINVEQEVKN